MRRRFEIGKNWEIVAALTLLLGITVGTAAEYDFKDPKGVNTIAFSLDSRLEPLRGFAAGVYGSIHFDPAQPDQTRGRILVAASSLAFANDRMSTVLKSPEWLDVGTHPIISFTLREILSTERLEENEFLLEVKGDFELRGVIREMTVPVRITHLPGELAARVGDEKSGDLIVLRTDFAISRLDYQIRPDLDFGKVARDIRIDVAIAGGSPVKAPDAD